MPTDLFVTRISPATGAAGVPTPFEALAVLLTAAIILIVLLLAVLAVLLIRPGRARTHPVVTQVASTPARTRASEPIDVAERAAAGEAGDAPEAKAGLSAATYDHVVRGVSISFLLAVGAIVLISDQWPEASKALLILLLGAFAYVLLVRDVLARSPLGPGKFAIEGGVALAVTTMTVTLTGGPESPFFFGYYLVVAGAALVVRGRTAFVAAAVTALVYGAAMAAYPGSDTYSEFDLLAITVNLAGLALLSYLAAAVALEQRMTRDAAVRLSLFDPLTQLFNRNYFFAVTEREIQRAARTNRRFCLLMIDLDGLKQVNDTFGHHYGDRILRVVADVIRAGVRGIDSAARYGGDEFVVILPETDLEGAVVLAEKLRRGIAGIRVGAGPRVLRTSASIGVVMYPDDGENADDLLMSADAAMYESKRLGKNRVVDRHGGIASQSVGVADDAPSNEADRGGPQGGGSAGPHGGGSVAPPPSFGSRIDDGPPSGGTRPSGTSAGPRPPGNAGTPDDPDGEPDAPPARRRAPTMRPRAEDSPRLPRGGASGTQRSLTGQTGPLLGDRKKGGDERRFRLLRDAHDPQLERGIRRFLPDEPGVDPVDDQDRLG